MEKRKEEKAQVEAQKEKALQNYKKKMGATA